MRHLLVPLRNSHSLITQLKQNIDYTGWTLAALSRPRTNNGSVAGNDALDQFAAVTKQLPIDCHKLVQWALTVTPSSAIRFLTTSQRDIADSSIDSSGYISYGTDFLGLPSVDSSDESKRHSTTSTLSTATATSSTDFQAAPPILLAKAPSDVTLNGAVNGGTEKPASSRQTCNDKPNRTTFSDTQSLMSRSMSSAGEGRVMEEDDLESVISDRDSLYQDYALAGEESSTMPRRRLMTSVPPTPQLSSEVVNALSEEDRQLLRFYSPQLDTHTEFLSKAIEEFLTVVEEQLPPREFVQKGKLVCTDLIILAAHKLIYIGDSIAQCVMAQTLSIEVRRAADRLCCVLKNCVQATKLAADQIILAAHKLIYIGDSIAQCVMAQTLSIEVRRAADRLCCVLKNCVQATKLAADQVHFFNLFSATYMY
uniref:CAS family C-terminal domain-containing protein n=1 Tax=Ascaris lumbricoides TaxID=6252 RepID=A0A9J2PT45_ASCLU